MPPYTVAILFLTSTITMFVHKSSAAAANDNAALLIKLCTLLDLESRVSNLEPATYTAQSNYNNLQDLNTTLSDPEWRAQLNKTEPAKTRPDKPKQPHETDASRLKRWKDWIEAEDRLEPKGKMEEALKRANLEGSSAQTRRTVHAHLQPILQRAAEINDELVRLSGEADAGTKEQVATAIKEALYGAGAASLKDITAQSTIGKTAASSQEDACGAQGTSSLVKTIAGITLCVCAKGSKSAGVGKLCSAQQGTTQLNTNFGNAATIAQDIVQQCPKAADEPPTSSEITAALETFLGTLTLKATHAYFGSYTATDCSGEAGSGACVIYAGGTKATVDEIKQTNWHTKLREAASKLKALEARNNKIETLNHLMVAEEQAAYKVAQQVQLTAAQAAKYEKTTKQDNQQTNREEADKCKTDKNQTAADCTKIGCDHDATSNKYKAKQGTETTAAGEPPKEGSAATRCVAHQDKVACENDKTGEKQNCGWRKGEDGENDKETEKCRDGSFLLNKKLALIVSASIVLLFKVFLFNFMKFFVLR
uniref:Variant surface glycoprotein 325 n=1 Tax=Trypanosoma brucei TaxID=5691 RepID=M4TD05_9TRYP|nr:variant surface glycoprotein 325 [Trypanosoma brucei]